ncbi:MAG: bifunctional rhamnulose-1-phosphate aldolase/short-chain dehydrogenase [Chloroflexota bacterium]
MDNLWQDAAADGLAELELLAYRSRLLGREARIVNYGGGNTSCKVMRADFRGRQVATLLVKATGFDLATIQPAGFAALRLEDTRALGERDNVTDDEMVTYLNHCLLDPLAPRPSIETLLHAVIPARHIDHTHADAAISLCATEGGQALAEQRFGQRMVWVPYVRPGFALGKLLAQALEERPDAEIIFLEKHGLVTWGEDARQCYNQTIRVITELEAFITERGKGKQPFGPPAVAPLPPEERRRRLLALLPSLRGLLSTAQRLILHIDQSDAVLEFAGSTQAEALASIGAACPDHVMYTKVRPMFVTGVAAVPDDQLVGLLQNAVQAYIERYDAYFTAHAAPGQARLDPRPRVVLLPGIGMVTAGIDVAAARNTAALFQRAIAVMRGAQALNRFVSLSPAEAFAIEYWPLELYKLSLRPPERELSRRVAIITGGASGIGRSTALGLAAEGAHVVLLDLNAEGAIAAAQEIEAQFGPGRAVGMHCDVTSEAAVQLAFEEAVLRYGGVDIVIPNAGLAASHSIEETSLAEWNRLHNVLTTGYFLTARAAFTVLRAQAIGGALVIMSSKNGLSAAKNVLAYATAKAAELQMTRCLAEEGGAAGIRVNAVAPDAVFRNSGIWNTQWREERSRSHGVDLDQLEEFYRNRAILKVNVYPEDVAEAVLFLCSDRSAKTTGCVLTVDGGVTTAYPR